MSAIRQTLEDIALAGHIKLSIYMKDAINAFLSPDPTIDPIQLSMLGIQQSLTSIRNKNNNSVIILPSSQHQPMLVRTSFEGVLNMTDYFVEVET